MKKTRIPDSGYKELRKGRYSQRGAFYFVTTCCYNKENFFLNKENIHILSDSIDWLENKKYMDLHFYIAMPNHVHFVFQLTGDKSLSEFVKSLKQFTGNKIKQRMKIETSVWQEGYYDHLVRKKESLLEIIKYCWYNSVRAGFVDDPKQYPYWRSKYDL